MDSSSLQGIVMTVGGLALVTLIGVGIRLVVMMAIQQRRERMNRQISERLRTLIAAYKTLGGSFTGNLAVDPAHLRDLRKANASPSDSDTAPPVDLSAEALGSDRSRRIRDAVEAALSDILLLGTDEHVRLAERAARDLVAGRSVHTHELGRRVAGLCPPRAAARADPGRSCRHHPISGPTRTVGSGGGKGRNGGGDAAHGGGRGGGGGMAMGGGMAIGGAGIDAVIATETGAPEMSRSS